MNNFQLKITTQKLERLIKEAEILYKNTPDQRARELYKEKLDDFKHQYQRRTGYIYRGGWNE